MQKSLLEILAVVGTVLGVACTPARNPSSEHAVLDENFYASHLTREFLASRDNCVEALRGTFVDMGIGLEVDRLEGDRHHMITTRKVGEAMAILPGSTRSVAGEGRTSGGERVTTNATVSSPPSVVTMKEQFKLYLHITGNESSCRIAGYRFRAWLQEQEITNDLRVAGIRYADEKYFNPLFAEVAEKLQTLVLTSPAAAKPEATAAP